MIEHILCILSVWIFQSPKDNCKDTGVVKPKGSLPNIARPKTPVKKDCRENMVCTPKTDDRSSVCTSSGINLDGHFMTRKERKNMVPTFKLDGAQGESAKNGLRSTSSTSPFPFPEYHEGGVVRVKKEKSLLTLPEQHHETSLPHMQGKTARSAFIGTSTQPSYKKLSINDLKASKDNFYGDLERQTKKIEQSSSVNEVKFKSELAASGDKKKTTGHHANFRESNVRPSVRPSSAVPAYRPVVTTRSTKLSMIKGKLR